MSLRVLFLGLVALFGVSACGLNTASATAERTETQLLRYSAAPLIPAPLDKR